MYKTIQHLSTSSIVLILLLISSVGKAQNFEDKTLDAALVTPVNLISFAANKLNNDILVTWKTASEYNNSHFVIERSLNGIDFVALGQVAGIGNTTVINTYNYTDANVPKVNMYYRLQQVDINATVKYSAIVLVKLSRNKEPLLSIYPNPIPLHKATLTVSNIANGNYTLSVKSLDGKTVLYTIESIIANNQILQLQLPETLQKGIYLLQVTNSNEVIKLVEKIIVQ